MKRIEPKAGQESVWDYPRPPRLERTNNILKLFLMVKLLRKQIVHFEFWKLLIRRFIIFRRKMCGWNF